MYYIIAEILVVFVFLSYISYRLYNMKDAESKIMKRIYSDRYYIFGVFVVWKCIGLFSQEKWSTLACK